MKRSVLRYSTWILMIGILLLGVSILRMLSSSAAASANEIQIIEELTPKPIRPAEIFNPTLSAQQSVGVIHTLPAPAVTPASPQPGGNLLPDTNINKINGESTKITPGFSADPQDSANNLNKVGFEKAGAVDNYEPVRIMIPRISLDAPVIRSQLFRVKLSGYFFDQWAAPDQAAAGWHPTSAGLGQKGNTVLNGHHNQSGEVFRNLIDLQEGDIVMVFTQNAIFNYVITNKMILQETGVTLQERMLNSRWIAPSEDERLTLVTCWPYDSNSHRLVIVAAPAR